MTLGVHFIVLVMSQGQVGDLIALGERVVAHHFMRLMVAAVLRLVLAMQELRVPALLVALRGWVQREQ